MYLASSGKSHQQGKPYLLNVGQPTRDLASSLRMRPSRQRVGPVALMDASEAIRTQSAAQGRMKGKRHEGHKDKTGRNVVDIRLEISHNYCVDIRLMQ